MPVERIDVFISCMGFIGLFFLLGCFVFGFTGVYFLCRQLVMREFRPEPATPPQFSFDPAPPLL